MGNGYSVGSKEEENVEICSHEVRNLYLYVMFSWKRDSPVAFIS